MTLKKINGGLVSRKRSALDGIRAAKNAQSQSELARKLMPQRMPDHEALVLLLDSSGSMLGPADNSPHGETKLAAAMASARILIENSIQGVTSASVVMFASMAQKLIGIEKDLKSVLDALQTDRIESGSTRMDLGLEAAHELLKRQTNPVRRIVLMTDGQSDLPTPTLRLAEQISKEGIVIDTVAFGRDADHRFLQGLSAYSKGASKQAMNGKDLRLTFKALDAVTRGFLSSGD